jgi:hypothetical protein
VATRSPCGCAGRVPLIDGLCAPCGLAAGQVAGVGPLALTKIARRTMGLPTEGQPYTFRTRETAQQRTYTVEYLGCVPDNNAATTSGWRNRYPVLGHADWPASASGPTLHFSRVRVYPPNSSVYLEATWHPSPDAFWTHALQGVEGLKRQDELKDAYRGEELLRGLPIPRVGRPVGTTACTIEQVQHAYWEYVDEVGEHPNRTELAAQLTVSARTLSRLCPQLRYPLPPPRPGAPWLPNP